MAAGILQKVYDFQQTPAEMSQRGILDAALLADWRMGLVARGFGWHADSGAFSTPGAGGGTSAVIDQDRPNMLISVDSGFTLIPLRIHVAAQVPLLATDSDEAEILIAADIALAAAGIGSATTALTPVNMRGGKTGCPATVYKTLSANITNPTLGLELAHAVIVGDVQGTPATALWTPLSLVYEPLNPPLLVGPCAIYVYHGGTVATTGFINADFLCIPSNRITGLV
ncbi:MAG TPA: hypothetical protein VI172_02365 [Candidatus Dormibacteraeota bacterium]|jgi:hypothetical protein